MVQYVRLLIIISLFHFLIFMDLEYSENQNEVNFVEKINFETQPIGFKLDQIYDDSSTENLKRQNLIRILSEKGVHNRSEKDIKTISELLKFQPYFLSISRNQKMLLQISSWIQLKKVSAGHHLYRIKDTAECFYILIKGEVHLSFPQKVVQDNFDQLQNQEQLTPDLKRMMTQPEVNPQHSTIMKRNKLSQRQNSLQQKNHLSKRASIHEQMITVPPITPQKQKIKFEERLVRVVSEGQSFGDLSGAGLRATNAIAKEPSSLLVIKRQYYSEIAKAHLKSDGKKKLDFLSNIPFLKLLNRASLESIIYLLEQYKVSYNTVIYNEEDPIKYIYIIYKGEFKLYKKVSSKKQEKSSAFIRQSGLTIQDFRTPQRNISYKVIQLGQILGYLESLQGNGFHLESCACKSQEGVVLRIDKNKFIKKVMNSDNNLQQINLFLKENFELKESQMEQFMKKQQNEEMYVRYLHTPSARTRTIKTQSASQREKSEKKQYLRRLSTANDNFFNKINETVIHQAKFRRISVNRIVKMKKQQEQVVPSAIKDIVQMVKHQTNYQRIRKPQANVTLFEFNISKVPLHVKKKFDFLFKKHGK